MAITGPASYVPTSREFIGHWEQADERLSPQVLVVRLPESNTVVTLAQFEALYDALVAQQILVQERLVVQGIERGGINLAKVALLKQLNLFTSVLDGYFTGTEFHAGRPYAPSFTDGKEAFLRPLQDAVNLWETINEGPAPAGVTLPLTLSGGVTQESFAAAVEALEGDYRKEQRLALAVTLARGKRNLIQQQAYAVMKGYREVVPGICAAFPALLESLPRLTPLPGHTPARVAAQAEFIAPDQSRVTHEASEEKTIKCYQLRGNAGESYNEEDAMVLATHAPEAPRVFEVRFGLTQAGARVALKVFVILETGNEAGSETMVVTRPADVAGVAEDGARNVPVPSG